MREGGGEWCLYVEPPDRPEGGGREGRGTVIVQAYQTATRAFLKAEGTPTLPLPRGVCLPQRRTKSQPAAPFSRPLTPSTSISLVA